MPFWYGNPYSIQIPEASRPPNVAFEEVRADSCLSTFPGSECAPMSTPPPHIDGVIKGIKTA